MLVRKDMSVLFGDETLEENNIITENGIEQDKAAGDAPPEAEQAVKRPAWLKQKRGKLIISPSFTSSFTLLNFSIITSQFLIL